MLNITISEIETVKCMLSTIASRLDTTQCEHVNTQINKIINTLVEEQQKMEMELFKK